jgi:hypothetical protein
MDRRQGHAGTVASGIGVGLPLNLSDKGDSALVAWQRLCSVGLRNGDAPASQLRHHRLPSARQAGCKCRPYRNTPLRPGLDSLLVEAQEPAQSLKRTL